MKKIILFLLVLFSALQIFSTAGAAIIVGRISHVEGQIFRFMDADNSWVETFLQSPAGIQDVLLTGDKSRAEIAFPNNQLMRLEENTEIEILILEDDSGEFTLHSGLARFYNRGSAGKMIVETARGTVKVKPQSSVDVQVDKKSIAVSAVYGEATFNTFQDGVERVEVISGSTRLEFHEKSIVAGVGPLDRKWDRWCAEREGVLAQNNLVRSDHLPESMQEYAYAMEPYGHWKRIYYRGYYYWAWKPQSVAVGWSPYTTGYWHDWRGSQVWIDYNPWGWVTHHHGHWLNLHGAWMWTPYVHVSHVPGVTVIGFNIAFGKRYRSHWHPGRVRWIGHNDYIGWLPLAPWETYYGYRKWGPRTVVVQGGTILSVNINLSSHRHIDHAIVIPKRHLHHRKPGVINNYKTVRVKNINKKTILKRYRSLHTVQRLREGRNSIKLTRTRGKVKKIESKPARRIEKQRKFIRTEKYRVKKSRTLFVQPNIQKEKTEAVKYAKGHSRKVEKKYSPTLENTRNKGRDRKTRGRVVRTEMSPRKRTVEKSSVTITKKREAVRDNARKSFAKKPRSKERSERIGQATIETVGKPVVRRERKTVAVRNKRVDERERRKTSSRISRMQGERKQKFSQKTIEEKVKYKEKENGEETIQRATVRGSRNSRERMASREKGFYEKRTRRSR